MAETIVFGGQKLEIDPNDELWKQLIEKYSKKKTGWEPMKIDGTVWCIEPTNPTFGGGVTQLLRNSYGGVAGDAHCAAFVDKSFCEMQARAEEIRRKMIRWVAEHDKPLSLKDDHWGLVYDADTCTWRAVCYAGRPNIFGVYCSSERLALEFAMFFEDELKWMFFGYKRRLDEVNE